MIGAVLNSWPELKLAIEHALDVSHDALHVLAGVLVFLGAALLRGRSIRSWFPWVTVLMMTLCNEAVDLWTEQWPSPGMQYGEGLKDLILTMLLPTILMIGARTRPDLFRRVFRSRSAKARDARTGASCPP